MKILTSALTILSVVMISISSKSQSSRMMATSCSCKEGQSICQADALFMSCCTCCQVGSSCGSWTAFGLCGCQCANTNLEKVAFYPNKYNEFMKYLKENGINNENFVSWANLVVKEKTINTGKEVLDNYVILEGESLKKFTDSYISSMKKITQDSKIASIVDKFINKK